MVDPLNLTDYNRDNNELEEMLLFSLLVAGKNALTTTKALNRLLTSLGWTEGLSPFMFLKEYCQRQLEGLLFKNGIGCYKSKAKSVYQAVNSSLDLKQCGVEELEGIHGCGRKTSRMFLLHSRRDIKVACLDVHILHYMADRGYSVPKTTPSSRKKYEEIERQFLELAKEAGQSVADFDLNIWRQYRSKTSSLVVN